MRLCHNSGLFEAARAAKVARPMAANSGKLRNSDVMGLVPNTATCGIPVEVSWTSTAPLIVPVSDGTHDLVAVKDPTVVRHNGRWHVYASSVSTRGTYNIVYTSFTDFDSALSSPLYYMDQTPGFDTYFAAPQLFYFTPQKKWYLVFQAGPPMYSTADDPADPTKWTRPAPFFAKTPEIITQNRGWLDFLGHLRYTVLLPFLLG